jgi:uncharacterized protein (TIGR03000 family)
MWRVHSSLAVFALGALLLTTEKAAAQWGPGQQGPLWNQNQGYSGRSYTPARTFAPAPTTSQSFFDAPLRDNRTVLIDVRVPADARIWFDDDSTKQTGPERLFVSPPLTRGKYYEYQVRAQWNENGKKLERTRRITVQAGDQIHLEFNSAQ